MRRLKLRVLFLCGACLVLAVVIVAFVLLGQRSMIARQVVPVATSEQAAQSFDEKLKGLKETEPSSGNASGAAGVSSENEPTIKTTLSPQTTPKSLVVVTPSNPNTSFPASPSPRGDSPLISTSPVETPSKVQLAKTPRPVTLSLTEQEVNSAMAVRLPNVHLPDGVAVSQVVVNLRGGLVIGSARVSVRGVDVSVGAKANIEIVDGKAWLVLEELDLGKVPLPQFVKDQIRALIPNEGRVSLSNYLPMDVIQAQIVDGIVVLHGFAR